MDDKSHAVDFKEEEYPLTIDFFIADGSIVHTIEVEEPGVVRIPQLADKYGPVGTRITLGNGRQMKEPPPGVEDFSYPEGTKIDTPENEDS